MKSNALRLLAAAIFVLLSADAFADGRRGRGGARYNNRAYVTAYAPVYAPVYRSAYYDDYWYQDRYVTYAPRPRYRNYVSYRPYPVYRYRPSLVIRFGGRR